ncbi:Leucine rich repeat/Leucine-rich repeat, putative [Leishmania shawi]|uniref:Leucine rich repeat/Leucine-rich repeat n=1 Tax=Leishmania shawi TaxID=5680 RepID=A0ABR3E784_9TRYP
MRAGNQQRYHDILRREAETQKRRLHRGSTPVSAQLSGTGSCDLAVTTRNAVSVRSGSSHDTESLSGFVSSASYVCDPLAELGIPLIAVPAVVNYVCDRRGFTSLHPNFLLFEHLRCIVLEHNALETLHHLRLPPSTTRASSAMTATAGLPSLQASPPLHRGCRRLTHLHVAYNRIRDIASDTDISRLSLLEHLSLAHNQLTDLDKVLRALKRLRRLHFLDLRGNPVTGETRYRERCVVALPQVEVLDCQSVTPKEREAAAAPARWHQRTHEEDHPCSTAAGTATTASRMRPHTSPSCVNAVKTAGDLFAKSLTTRDLERNYVAHLRRQRQAQEAAAQRTSDAWRQQEETWESFHAVWTLSQPGMPLSADGWQRVQIAAAASSDSAEGDGERSETQSSLFSTPNLRLPASRSAGASAVTSPLHAARKQATAPSVSPVTTTTTAAATPTHVSGGSGTVVLSVTIDVPLDRPLFPSSSETAVTPESSSPQAAAAAAAAASTKSDPLSLVATATPLLPSLYDSAYFRTLRGGSATSRTDTVPLLPAGTSPPAVSSLLPVEGPSSDRLATLQRTLQASAHVVRVAAARQSPLGTLKKPAAAATAMASSSERALSGRRNVAPSSSPLTAAIATSVPVELSTLRTIQETKYAVIPPPWEGASEHAAVSPGTTGALKATPHCIGVISAATTHQEALTEILVLLHDVYSLNELQMLEGEYGGAELLRLLPLREWSVRGADNGTGEARSTTVAAKQAMSSLSRPGNPGSGGGGSGRGPASQHDRKRFAAAKGIVHRGSAGAGSAGAAAARGGNADAAGGVPTAAAAVAAARAALPSDPQQVWQLLTGPYIVAGTAGGESPGAAVTLGKSSGSATNSASPAEATSRSNAEVGPNASSGATAATAPLTSLQDPEVVRHLVRPIGPYASHVLGPLLTLLRAPVAEENVQPMCDALAAHHTVDERVVVAAAMAAPISRSTTAEPQPRSVSAGPRSKKELVLVTEDSGSAQVKSKRPARGAALASFTDAVASASRSPVPSAMGPQTRTSTKAAQVLLQQSVPPQLTLTAVLTSLLFSPAFVRSRVAYLEEKLTRLVSATAATSVITAADHADQKSGLTFADRTSHSGKGNGAATTLARLFHRVQAVKMHAARIEAALAVAGPSSRMNDTSLLLDPTQVLTTYTGHH